ncbi:MAG TPA: SgcJ/EcaC family oxidoreductase [Lacipirellulaceae bacterium]|nr:SgcJ/EcaC family oxidoreductase [Lacipirellulaceae bacterium]
MTKTKLSCVLIACCFIDCTAIICRADQAKDEAAIRKSDAAYVEAYNKHDAKAIASMWSPEAVYVDPETGEESVGREEIEKEFADTFANMKDAKLTVDVRSIKFLSPNVAVETGTARVIASKGEPSVSGYSALFVKRDGTWLLDRVTEEEPPAPPPSNYKHLKELEWMVGSWIDSEEGSHTMIQTDCQWTKNKSFMTRSFAVVVGDQVNMAGMQIVGWDPIAKQIHSWVFDSDGGFSEGKWTRKGNRWVIQQTGTLPDGSKSSAVNIIREIDNNSFKWQSVQRSAGGDILPDLEEVTIVRKPSQEQTAASR